jgi:hypothetical protein
MDETSTERGLVTIFVVTASEPSVLLEDKRLNEPFTAQWYLNVPHSNNQ